MLLILASGMMYGANQGCYADVRAYDPLGRSVPVKIIAIEVEGRNLLAIRDEKGESAASLSDATPGRIQFSTKIPLPSAELSIELIHQSGRKLHRRIQFVSCKSQLTVSVSERDSGFDVSVSRIKGTLRGCDFSADWWIRAFPMFGGQDSRSFEGSIIDGSAEIVGSIRGVRHVVVIGRGPDPVKAFAVNVEIGGEDNVFGTVDLSQHCDGK